MLGKNKPLNLQKRYRYHHSFGALHRLSRELGGFVEHIAMPSIELDSDVSRGFMDWVVSRQGTLKKVLSPRMITINWYPYNNGKFSMYGEIKRGLWDLRRRGLIEEPCWGWCLKC
jgi:hypothetical protein